MCSMLSSPALGMDADPLELVGGRLLKEPKVRLAEHAEFLERLLDARLLVSKSARPEILVISSQDGTILRQHHAEAITPHEL